MTRKKNGEVLSNNQIQEMYVGKTVTFSDGEDEYEGEVTEVDTAGNLIVDCGENNYEVTVDDVTVVEDEEEEEESDEVEIESEPEEEVEETEDVVEEDKITLKEIKEADKEKLKQIRKDYDISVPLRLWKDIESVRELIADALGFDVTKKEEPKTVAKKEKSEEKTFPKEEESKKKVTQEKKVSEKPAKEKAEKPKTKKISLNQTIANLFKKGGGNTKEMLRNCIKAHPEQSEKSIIAALSGRGAFLVYMGLAEKRDKGYYMK